MSILIEMDLKEILTKLDQRLDRIEQKIDRVEEKLEIKVNNFHKEMSDLKAGQARIEGELTRINKRLDNQEFLSIGILVGFMIAILGGLAKLFGFIANP